MGSSCTGIAFVSLRTLGSSCTSIAFVSLRTLGSSCTGIAFITLIAFWTFKRRVIFQSIFVQCDKDSFVAIIAYFLCLQAIAKIKLQIADCHIRCNRRSHRIRTTSHFTAIVDMDRHIHDALKLGHVDSISIIEASSKIRNLTSMIGITDGNSSPRRFPFFIIRSTSHLCQRIVPMHILRGFSSRTSTDGYAAFNSGIGIIAENGNIFLIRCQWICLIS